MLDDPYNAHVAWMLGNYLVGSVCGGGRRLLCSPVAVVAAADVSIHCHVFNGYFWAENGPDSTELNHTRNHVKFLFHSNIVLMAFELILGSYGECGALSSMNSCEMALLFYIICRTHLSID